MNQSWHRFVKLREFRQVLGWVRTTEVTRGVHSTAHPHFHCLLMVPASYFKKSYVTQSRWVQLWRQAARLDYDPVVDVRIVKSRGADGIAGAVAEALKYAVKPSDMLGDASWFLELTRQVRRTRAVASGGVLMHALRDERSEADLLTPDPDAPPVEAADDLPPLVFSWRDTARRYQRRRVEPARAGALDASAWRAGYDAGAAHAPCRPPAGACGVSWSSGWIEGDAAQRRSA